MSELDGVRSRIAVTEADLDDAKRVGDRDMILMVGNNLAELRRKENLLQAQISATG